MESACIVNTSGEVFCWNNALLSNGDSGNQANVAGHETLNMALNSDIAEISLSGTDLCGIGNTAGVACVHFDEASFIPNLGLDTPPEPDATYIAITSLKTNPNVCGIQLDNRVVCWGDDNSINEVPPEAAYLKQVDVFGQNACGIDLTDRLVCWGDGNPDAGLDAQFGLVDPLTIGTAKQVSMSPFGACILDGDDELQCFAGVEHFTDVYAGQTFTTIGLDSSQSPTLCFERTNGEHGCESVLTNGNVSTSESILPMNTDARLISHAGSTCYVTTDDDMQCFFSKTSLLNQFPTAPANLSMQVYSPNSVELFWTRPSELNFEADFATGYEIYRNDELIKNIAVGTSYFDGDADVNATYRVRALRGAVAGASSSVSVDNDSSASGTADTQSNVPVLELSGLVYSSTALEIFWNRLDNPNVRYDIFRDNELVRADSPAVSQVDSSLEPNTTYVYTVDLVLNGVTAQSRSIELTTSSL